MIIEAECTVCHKTFLKVHSRDKRCLNCRKVPYYTKVRTAHAVVCKQCGTEFITDLYNKEFCSNKCRERFHYAIEEVAKVCKVCGREFKTSRINQIYCSEACRKTKEV